MKNSAPGIRFILVCVFLDMLGVGLMVPVLPTLVGHLVASRELQAYWYGILASAYGLTQFFCSPILGALSDRFGRRPVMLTSIIGLGLDFLVIAFAPNVWVLLIARIVGGATGASFTVANAYVADITPEASRGKSFGLIGAMFGLGFMFGPALGGVLGDIDVRLPFYVAAGLSLINAIYGYFGVPESLPAEKRQAFSLRKANPISALSGLVGKAHLRPLLIVIVLSTYAMMTLQSTWVLYTTFRFEWGPWQNGISLFIVGLTATLVQGVLLGRILKNFGEARTAMWGIGSSIIAYTLYGLVPMGWMIYVVIACNLMSFTVNPSLQALISRQVSPFEQGITQGAISAVSGLIGVITPIIGTSLLAKVSHLPAGDWRIGINFYVCAVLQLVSLLIVIRHLRVAKPPILAN